MHTFIQHSIQHSNVHSFINSNSKWIQNGRENIFSACFGFEWTHGVHPDDEKPTRGKAREWLKRREESGYFNNIVKELKVEDRLGFREMFWMDVGDFEFIQSKISYLISFRQMSNFGGHLPIMSDERLVLTLR